MHSAFGIDHGDLFAKARRGPGVVRGRRSEATSMVERGGSKPYFNPSSEQVAAAKARRTQQAASRVAVKTAKVDPNRRVGGGKKYPLKMAMNEVGELQGLKRVVTSGTLTGGALLAGAYGANRYARSRDIKKVDDRNRDRARVAASGVAGGAGGALLAQAGMNMGGQTAKAKLKQRRAMRGVSPNEEKIWREHKAKYPGPANNTARHLNYPKALPDWRAQRALAFKNKPSAGKAGLATGAVAGLAYGVHQARKK